MSESHGSEGRRRGSNLWRIFAGAGALWLTISFGFVGGIFELENPAVLGDKAPVYRWLVDAYFGHFMLLIASLGVCALGEKKKSGASPTILYLIGIIPIADLFRTLIEGPFESGLLMPAVGGGLAFAGGVLLWREEKRIAKHE